MAQVVENEGQFVKKEQGFIDRIIDAATLPFAVVGKENNTYVDKKTAGISSLVYLGLGVFIGDKWGDNIPLIGKRR